MSTETRNIILEAALKIFAEEGYVGAKTRVIAEESGYSEMTLFRKFKNKENLFDTVLIEQKKRIIGAAYELFKENQLEDPIESLRLLIRQIYTLIEENFRCVSLYINERRRVSENVLDEVMIIVGEQIKLKFPDMKMNTKVFAFNILSFLYLLVFDKIKGYSFIDHEEALEEFTEYIIKVLNI
ncbi:TetR/AcrR family transcriptional regulator [Methanobacterium sp. ACI-7]|uniref:TetR/AcrR family transcriptional regulator n=1 Tax=unclassified Methanobacterium TaxID=2627676 RepID=UPI0039C39539